MERNREIRLNKEDIAFAPLNDGMTFFTIQPFIIRYKNIYHMDGFDGNYDEIVNFLKKQYNNHAVYYDEPIRSINILRNLNIEKSIENFRTYLNKTFYVLIRKGYVDAIDLILSYRKIDVNFNRGVFFNLVCELGYDEILEKLLELDPYESSINNGCLNIAIEYNNPKCVKKLLEHKVRVNLGKDNISLAIAKKEKNIEIVETIENYAKQYENLPPPPISTTFHKLPCLTNFFENK